MGGVAGAATATEVAPAGPEVAAPLSVPAAFRRLSVRGRLLTAGALLAFVAGSVALIAAQGLFLSRDIVFVWVLVGLFAVSLGDVNGYLRGVLFDWLPFFAALFLYDLLRGTVADSLFAAHTFPQIHADEILFGGQVPTVWLQERLFDPASIQWYDFAAWGVYLTHFFAVFLIAAYLWRKARPLFRRFRNMVLTLTAMAFTTYALFPAVPPWLASDQGDLGSAQRVVGAVWSDLGVAPAAAIWEKGSSFANEVAAIPSLHTAYPVLILLFFWPSGNRLVRGICLAYALAMSATLVYTGEHYVFDVLLGWAYAAGAYLIVDRLSAVLAVRRRQRRPAAAPAPAPGEGEPTTS